MGDRDEIVVLEGLEAVRRRPAMYVGNLQDGTGREWLVWHAIEAALGQHLLCRARALRIDVDGLDVTVEDDAERAWSESPRTLAYAISTLFAGAPPWREHHPGLELAIVNALSESMTITTTRAERAWRVATSRGRVVEPLAEIGPGHDLGTRIRFRPDASVFGAAPFDLARIERRLRELAWLNPLLTVTWRGDALPGHGGIARWARELAGSSAKVVAAQRRLEEIDIDVALGWRTDGGAPEVHSFVNQRRTAMHGAHVDGLMDAVLESAGLVAIVSVLLDHPQFSSGARDRLVNGLGRRPVRDVVASLLSSPRM